MQTHDEILAGVAGVQERRSSRRGVLRGAAAGGALTLAAGIGSAPRAAAQNGAGDAVSVLNYALTLEHLENVFYRDGLAAIGPAAFDTFGFDGTVFDYLAEIGANETAHVETLTSVITDLGGEPVAEGTYDFGDAFASVETFLATAQALENTGVDAYTGAAQFLIDEDELLTAALTIHGVEARHAAYLNILNDTSPFPDAFDEPLTPAEVVAIASDFINDAEVATPAAFEGGDASGAAAGTAGA